MIKILSALLVLAAATQQAPAKRVPVPSRADQDKALKLIRDIFQDEYAARTPQELAELARKLLQQARENKADPVSRYAFCSEAMDLGVKAGDTATAMEAAGELGAAFEVDAAAIKAEVLDKAARRVRSPGQAAELASFWLSVLPDALAADDYGTALTILSKAESAARKARDGAIVAHVRAVRKQIGPMKSEYQKAQTAMKTLETNPDDPDANLAVGRYTCFVRNEWKQGAFLLSRGSDRELRVLGEREMAPPQEAVLQAGLGDGWWEAADRERDEVMRARVRARAVHWYRLAMSSLEGLAKLRVQKRLESDEAAGLPEMKVNLLALIDPNKDAVETPWHRRGAGIANPADEGRCRVQVPYVPPDEYDLTVTFERKEPGDYLLVGLVAGGSQFSVYTRTNTDESPRTGLYRVEDEDRAPRYREPIFTGDRPVTFVIQVRRTGVAVSKDGKILFDWKGDYKTLSLSDSWALPNKQALFLGVDEGQIVFTRLELLARSGVGRRLR